MDESKLSDAKCRKKPINDIPENINRAKCSLQCVC